MRRCTDRVEVLAPRAPSTGSTQSTRADSVVAPLVFRWRGRRYVVSHVLADWIEVEPWWTGSDLRSEGESEQRWWRVEAGRRSAASTQGQVTGVFDLCWRDGGWSMRRIAD
jgi:hypothetical protein